MLSLTFFLLRGEGRSSVKTYKPVEKLGVHVSQMVGGEVGMTKDKAPCSLLQKIATSSSCLPSTRGV